MARIIVARIIVFFILLVVLSFFGSRAFAAERSGTITLPSASLKFTIGKEAQKPPAKAVKKNKTPATKRKAKKPSAEVVALNAQLKALAEEKAAALLAVEVAKQAAVQSEKEASEARTAAIRAQARADFADNEKARQAESLSLAEAEKAKAVSEKKAEAVGYYHPPYVEMGVKLANNIGVSSSPITGVGVTPRTGYGVSVVGSTGIKNVDYTLGFARQLYDFSLEGVALGSILSTTLEAGARYNFKLSNERVTPFVGAGLYNTKFDGHTLLGNTLKVEGIGVSGVVVEAGARYQIKQSFYVGASVRQYFGETGFNRLMTNIGSAQLTMYNLSNARSLVLSAGGNFD